MKVCFRDEKGSEEAWVVICHCVILHKYIRVYFIDNVPHDPQPDYVCSLNCTTNVRHEHAELQSQEDYTHELLELLRCCEWCRLDWHVAMGVGDERMRYGRQPNDVP